MSEKERHEQQVNSMHKALHDLTNQMQIALYRHETSPPLTRSEILRVARKKLSDIDMLVGRKNGTEVFRMALIDLASYLTFAAASCESKAIGHE